MKSMKQIKLESNPWDWTPTIEPASVTKHHIAKAYRFEGFKPCKIPCRRNLKKNPFCLCNLGERKWIKQDGSDEREEINDFRAEGEFAGLQNLGATCYVNSLLQLWFHNPILRPAILEWRPMYEIDENDYVPKCPIGQLQAMFARMKFSKQKSILPTAFVNELQLNTTEQQDAQEFSKLFMEVIVGLLTHDENQGIKTMISDAFQGLCQYETTCLSCNNTNKRSEHYSELELNVRSQLETGLTELFNVEELNNDNRYRCNKCHGLSDATRCMKLVTLPPVLNLQLKRFSFSLEQMQKKKISTTVDFPEILDFSNIGNMVENSGLSQSIDDPLKMRYELSAVLIHNGPNATSGHYITHIKDIRSGKWYKFNDESVDTVSGPKLVITKDKDEDSENKKTKSKPKSENGEKEESTQEIGGVKAKVDIPRYKSDGAYMLVYTRSDLSVPMQDQDLPPYLKKLVQREDEEYEIKVLSEKKLREAEDMLMEQRRALIGGLYCDLYKGDTSSTPNGTTNGNNEKENDSGPEVMEIDVDEPENQIEYDFISSTWLTNWLQEKTTTIEHIAHCELLCIHDKIKPVAPGQNGLMQPVNYKFIPKHYADFFYKLYGGSHRFQVPGGYCSECVKLECKKQREMSKLHNDFMRYQDLYKKVEKEAQKLEKENFTLEDSIDEDGFGINFVWIGKEAFKNWKKFARDDIEDGQLEVEGIPGVDLNQELVCPHGNLTADKSNRKLISYECYTILSEYFPMKVFSYQNTPTCGACLTLLEKDCNDLEECKIKAAEYKQAFPDLFFKKNRPSMDDPGKFFVVPSSFIHNLRGFIREPRTDTFLMIENMKFICPHELFSFSLEFFQNFYNEDLADHFEEVSVVFPREWELLSSMFPVDVAIKLENTLVPATQSMKYVSEPNGCERCISEFLTENYRNSFRYEGKTINVRKREKEDSNDIMIIEKEVPNKKEKLDKDFQPNNFNKSQNVKRSLRSKRKTGEKTYDVSSSTTIHEIKRMSAKDFHAAISDQHLYYNDKELGNQHTLEELEIRPGSTLIIEIDEAYVPCATEPMQYELGFQGTRLAPFNMSQFSNASPTTSPTGQRASDKPSDELQ